METRTGCDKLLVNAHYPLSPIRVLTHLRILREHGAEKELSDGKTLINAIKSTPSVKTFLWSGIESVSKISHGKYTHVEHFDTKVCSCDVPLPRSCWPDELFD
jgi:hypothetical protein